MVTSPYFQYTDTVQLHASVQSMTALERRACNSLLEFAASAFVAAEAHVKDDERELHESK